MACSSSCRTQDHPSWGACVRAKNLRTPALSIDALGEQKTADRTLDRYEAVRRQGIQPKSTRAGDIDRAVRISDKTGEAFQA